MRKAVITGPTGAIGHALIERLVSDGVEVYAVTRKNSLRNNTIPANPLVHIVYSDLSELSDITEIPDDCDVFYHFAWAGTFGDVRNDMGIQVKNIAYTLDAVELAKRTGCKVFIGAGSQAEYGRVEGLLTSDTPAFPENGYGMAKLCAGQMSRVKCRQLGIKHIWTRILSVYGPYDGEKTMVMSAIDKFLANERAGFTKGEQQWDYLYSKDAAGILKALAEHGIDGKIYCLGSGKVRPLAEYIQEIKKACHSDSELGMGDVPYGEKQVMYLCADTTELLKDTGYKYQYTFEEGIEETVTWMKEKR